MSSRFSPKALPRIISPRLRRGGSGVAEAERRQKKE